jgi:hypothetical protein
MANCQHQQLARQWRINHKVREASEQTFRVPSPLTGHASGIVVTSRRSWRSSNLNALPKSGEIAA